MGTNTYSAATTHIWPKGKQRVAVPIPTAKGTKTDSAATSHTWSKVKQRVAVAIPTAKGNWVARTYRWFLEGETMEVA